MTRADKGRILPMTVPLVGFSGERGCPVGAIALPVTTRYEPTQATVMTDFIIIDKPSTYNAIIGRPTLNALKAVVLTFHLVMKFPTESGIGVVTGDQEVAHVCYNAILKEPCLKKALNITVEVCDEHKLFCGEPVEDLVEVSFNGPDRAIRIGSQLSGEAKASLALFLQKNLDVFAWTHQDMLGVDPAMITHRLNVDPTAKPVK